MRDRLIELFQKRSCFYNKSKCNAHCSNCDYVTIDDNDISKLADHLLANGVTIPPCEEICGCFVPFSDFGENVFLDKAEAERALKGGEG